MFERGQTVLIDFSLAVFIFFIAFAFLTIFWVQNIEEKTKETQYFDMDLKANIASEILVKSRGNPVNWHEIDTNQINFIGLAFRERSIDEQKLNTFKNMAYDTSRELLNISEYDFYFEFTGEDNVTVGLVPTANVDSITITRIVEYKGSEAIARITLYQS